MKRFSTLLLLPLSVFAPLSSAQVAAGPAELSNLEAQYIRAVDQAVRPLTMKYEEALKALKIQYTKAGRLEDAIATENAIKALAAKSDPSRDAVLENILTGNAWTYTAGSRVSEIQFEANNSARMTGEADSQLQWSVTNNRYLTIIYTDGNTCRFDFGDLSNLSITGTFSDRNKSTRHLAPRRQPKKD